MFSQLRLPQASFHASTTQFMGVMTVVMDTLRINRRQRNLLVVFLSMCSLIVLTALQLRAQALLTFSIMRQNDIKNDTIPPLLRSSNNRRMQERGAAATVDAALFSSSSAQHSLRYLAIIQSTPAAREIRRVGYVDHVGRLLDVETVPVPIQSAIAAAACTQSLLGDLGEFHIISMEFSQWDDSHDILIRRLRKRFPSATIVLVRRWSPLGLRCTIHGEEYDLEQWLVHKGIKTRKLSSISAAITASGDTQWYLTPTPEGVSSPPQHDGFPIVSLPIPSHGIFHSSSQLTEWLAMFDDHVWSNLSPMGQGILARDVSFSFTKVGGIQSKTPPLEGSWGTGDLCNIWDPSANVTAVSERGRRVNLGAGKYAVEFRRLCDDTIRVDNPFGTARMLFLSYLTSYELDMYPEVRVKLNGMPTVVIKPIHTVSEQSERHLTRTTAVGVLPAGQSSLIQIDPQEHSRYPFRLVGTNIVAEEMLERNYSLDFTLEMESLPRNYDRFWYLF